MSATIRQIGEMLTEENLHWKQVQDRTLSLSFSAANFTNQYGGRRFAIRLEMDDGGRYLTTRVPIAFQLRGEYVQETMELLLRLQSLSTLVRFDHSGGFVSLSVDLPLDTMDLDAGSLGAFIRTLVHEIESTLSAFKHTMATGEIVVRATPPGRLTFSRGNTVRSRRRSWW